MKIDMLIKEQLLKKRFRLSRSSKDACYFIAFLIFICFFVSAFYNLIFLKFAIFLAGPLGLFAFVKLVKLWRGEFWENSHLLRRHVIPSHIALFTVAVGAV